MRGVGKRSRRGGREPLGARGFMNGKGVGAGGAGGIGVEEEAGVCHITAAEGWSDGGDVHATAKTCAQGSGRRRAQSRRDQKSRKQVEGVAAVEEAAEVLELVNGLAGGQGGIAFDAMAKDGNFVVFLETHRQIQDGIGAGSLEFGERR